MVRWLGSFVVLMGSAATQCATQWTPMPAGASAVVRALAALDNGDVVAGGEFASIGGVAATRIARWNGSTWSGLGAGLNGTVHAVVGLANGDIVAGGAFTAAGGVPAANIARWDGSSWSPLGTGTSAFVASLVTLADGSLAVGGYFTMAGGIAVNHVARWDGTNWSSFGSGVNSAVPTLATTSTGDLIAGGFFTTAGGVSAPRVARWNGSSWSSIGAGIAGSVASIASVVVSPQGDIFAFGAQGASGGIANRWDGTTWQPMGFGLNGPAWAATALPDGDVVAGGTFDAAGTVFADSIARWTGADWQPFGAGTDSLVLAMTLQKDGQLWVGGFFTAVGGQPSAFVGRLTTSCPATVTSAGLGCTGTGGANQLAASSRPWIGGTFRTVATGAPANALAVGVLGLQAAALPLAAILPHGGGGCQLLVGPDAIEGLVPAAGSVTSAVQLPDTLALAGLAFHQQVVIVALGPVGDITEVTSTNALSCVIGVF